MNVSICNMFHQCRVRAVEVPCVLNIAAVKLKSKEYDDVIKECNKILDMEVSEKKDSLSSRLLQN